MQHVLEHRATGNRHGSGDTTSPHVGFSGWSSVDDVMQVLSEGVREYRTRRDRIAAAEQKGQGVPLSDGVAHGAHGSLAVAATAASFVYEEADRASAFFLPYSWSLAMDLTRDFMWPCDAVGLFPMRPFFREEAEALRRRSEEDESDAAARRQQQQQQRRAAISADQPPESDVLMSPL